MRIVEKSVMLHGSPGTPRAMYTFPTLCQLSAGALLATCRAGWTKDSDDETVSLYRSDDSGRTWRTIGPFSCPELDDKSGSLKLVYLTEISREHLLGAAMWVDRQSYPGQPLFNPKTEGCLPMAILLAESYDAGATWSPWRRVPMPPQIGPPSLTNPILRLPDGTLLMSIETNKNYTDGSKWYQKVVLLHSNDNGRTWGQPIVASQDPSGRTYNWDQRAVASPDGPVATFAWTYDSAAKQYINIHRRLSFDGGWSWTPPSDIGIADQAGVPTVLPDGRVVLPWVDRFQSRSIRARLAKAVDAPFEPLSEIVLYEHSRQGTGAFRSTADVLAEMGLWTFGLPFAEALSDGSVLVLYYAGDSDRLDIHQVRLTVD